MSHTVRSLSCKNVLRITELIVQAYEGLPVGVESIDRNIHTIEGIVVTALLIFSFMIYHRTIHLHLSCREVALKVLHIGSSIPQTPLCE